MLLTEGTLRQWCNQITSQIAVSAKNNCDLSEKQLYTEERALISEKAVLKRKTEFCLGRQAAHAAIGDLTHTQSGPVLKGAWREPLWPQGMTGSLSHSGTAAVAAVGWKEHFSGIGIDLEYVDKPVSLGIARRVCTASELDWVMSGAGEEEIQQRLILIFSAKESIFKAFFPMEFIPLDFCDAQLEWIDSEAKFQGELLKDASARFASGYRFIVNCLISQPYICTLVNIKREGMRD